MVGEMVKKSEILCDIKQKVLELKSLYPDTSLKVVLHVSPTAKAPEAVKCEITEVA
jgi:hypothetical protein